jgi:hypothetical protein
MITNGGKEVISKYLLGQIPEYATHISIGCGAFPLGVADPYPSAATLQVKEVMDFEMARVPIISRGFVNDTGEIKIALTAELPVENRYDMTEIGLWSAGSNVLASGFDSKIIFTFNESWEKHGLSIEQIPTLDTIGQAGDITTTENIFYVSSSDSTLRNTARIARKEGPRFLNSKILMRGDTADISATIINISQAQMLPTGTIYTVDSTTGFSIGDVITISGCSNPLFNFIGAKIVDILSNTIVVDSQRFQSSGSGGISTGSILYFGTGQIWETGSWTTSSDSVHIHNNAVNFDISKNSPNDKIKLAISLTDKTATADLGNPDNVKLIFNFYRNEVTTTKGFAKTEIYVDGEEFANSRYKIIEIPISDLITSSDYTSYEARTCTIFASVEKSGSPSSDYYVVLDALRLDNISTANPLYKMVGYSVIKDGGNPLVKYPNTNNYVEFRFSLGI